jgi:hypothetical protein
MNQKKIVASYIGLAMLGRAWLGSMALSSEKGPRARTKCVGEEMRPHVTQFVYVLRVEVEGVFDYFIGFSDGRM